MILLNLFYELFKVTFYFFADWLRAQVMGLVDCCGSEN
ncbi:MAG: hypothetical protein BWX80_01024 [Candidatus Hydrogenedentes bacterium ADurb.Bin101]|jgi:hypothetical protein|nr:MAG: hypothetical protein BWX80_01024 [Candidatus Hydrogenedentes bacterium ADurb.Bin101]